MKKIEFVLNIPSESNLVNLCTGMVHHASEFVSDINLSVDGGHKIDLKSILGIMSLAVLDGAKIEIEARGADAEEAIKALEEMIK